jgi:hypothetical protein
MREAIAMRAALGAVVLAGAAVLAAVPPAGPAAAAAKTWTVSPGRTIEATAGKTTLTDTTTGTILNCSSSTMSGTLKRGGGLPGSGIGSIAAAAYDCATPIGNIRLTARGLPWHLNRTGVSHGTISHVQLALLLPGCSAAINGTSSTTSNGAVAVTHANATGKLKVLPAGGSLHWYHVNGCAGLVADGDPAALSATYAISPAQTITSP